MSPTLLKQMKNLWLRNKTELVPFPPLTKNTDEAECVTTAVVAEKYPRLSPYVPSTSTSFISPGNLGQLGGGPCRGDFDLASKQPESLRHQVQGSLILRCLSILSALSFALKNCHV